MKSKKLITGVLSATMLTLPVLTVLGAEDGAGPKAVPIGIISALVEDSDTVADAIPIMAPLEENMKANYKAMSGTVIDIRDHGNDGSKCISVGADDEITANIIISDDTYIVDNAEIGLGSVVIWFVDMNRPMILIYPPQYYPEAVAVEKDGQNVKFDIFDGNLVSSDNQLKLNVSKDTVTESYDGNVFETELAGKKLLVIYGPSTKSIPAQTNPEKIVVFPEEEIPADEGQEGTEQFYMNASEMDIVVNNKKIEGVSAYNNEDGTVMVPLRAIAEALGFDVKWDDEQRCVMVGKAISLKIDEDNYIYAKTAPIKLGTAPALAEGLTYVPLSFFKEVAKVNNAYVFERQIDINDGEPMM